MQLSDVICIYLNKNQLKIYFLRNLEYYKIFDSLEKKP